MSEEALPALLSAAETAAAMRVSKSAVFKWARLGELPSVHLGRRLLFVEADVAAFIAARRTSGAGADVVELATARGSGR